MKFSRLSVTTLLFLAIFLQLITFMNFNESMSFIENQTVEKKNLDIFNPHNSVDAVLSTDENKFLPGTNLSVSEYLDEEFKNTFNVSILSITPAQIDVRCDYSITENAYSQPFTSQFYSTINRTSVNDTYSASNYFGWNGLESTVFDFWIDPSKFYVGYPFPSEVGEIEVESKEMISMKSVGEFEAWKLNATDEYGYKYTMWYDSINGTFLCLRSDEPIFPLWYNLTKAEFAVIPSNYQGPYIDDASPVNGSSRPNGTELELSFFSPYGIEKVYYQWDDMINVSSSSSEIKTAFLDTEDIHHLYVTAIDGIGGISFFKFLYVTDNRIPGISLSTLKNNSRINGLSSIQLTILSGNGSFIYNWDGTGNTTVLEGTSLSLPNPSSERNITLNICAMNNDTNAWSKTKFTFQIDNTPPMISTYDLINGSILKGTVNFKVKVSEKGYIRYLLNNESNNNFTVEVNRNYSISLENLDNGSYSLEIFATDEANNTGKITLNFSIYTSAFNWDWQIVANTLRKINVVNETGDLLFIVTLLSGSNQKFNLTLVPEGSSLALSDDMEYAVELMCENPADILFITFSVMLEGSREDFPIYLWFYWDNEDNSWQDMGTSYSEVTHSWEATYDGYIQYFGLINTHETTGKKSVIVGGGQIPSFEYFPALISVILLSLLSRNFRKKRSKENSR
ncbi:MAG: hypothetical protein ACW964_12895 [Candidatus Hodarchaeales archaeon]|jgi:hypothetical protein